MIIAFLTKALLGMLIIMESVATAIIFFFTAIFIVGVAISLMIMAIYFIAFIIAVIYTIIKFIWMLITKFVKDIYVLTKNKIIKYWKGI